MVQNELQIENLRTSEVKDYSRQLRTPTKKQTEKTIRVIQTCGIPTPIIIDKNNEVVIGQHILEALRQMNVDEVPVIRADHLDEVQIKILRIAYDRIAEEADWEEEAVAQEFHELEILMPELDLTITGFEVAEVDLILDFSLDSGTDEQIPEVEDGPAVTQLGDFVQLGDHRLYCGTALENQSFNILMEREMAQMCFTDAPYNVPILGHVSGNGKKKHKEFVEAAGEKSREEFIRFLTIAHENMADYSEDGAVIYSCMDWRHLLEIQMAAENAGLIMINLCVWAKDNGGLGCLYRSRHELVFVFKNGAGKYINNVELGKHGRNRTNVWEYPGASSFGKDRMKDLALHPTVKPTQMVVDAIKDCSARGGIILDIFGGSGTTLIAAEQTGRKARLIELDPHYCDVTIRRWQELTGEDAINLKTKKTFNETEPTGK